MTIADVDWRYLRGALITLAITSLIGGGLFLASASFSSGSAKEFNRARAKLLSNRNKYHTLDEEEQIIAEYLPRYQALEERGLVGRERRLDWIEKLRSVAREVGVPELRYSIEAQREFEQLKSIKTGKFKLYASTMRLDLGLLHEGDLFALLDRLERRATGVYTVRRCNFRRAHKSVDMRGTVSNVTATCEIDWLTLREPRKEDAS